MATGMALPPRARNGALALESDEDQLSKIILIRHADNESRNPYEDARGLEARVFRVASRALKALLRRRSEAHFRELEQRERASLQSLDIEEQGAELELRIRYVDLERDRERELTQVVGAGG